MKVRFSRRRIVLSAAAAVLVLLLYYPVKNVLAVIAVQNAVWRDYEISFGYGPGARTDRPAMLPVALDNAAEKFFEHVFARTRGLPETELVKTRNRDITYHERFRAFFRGPIDEVHIYYCEGFRSDVGEALGNFPHLRRVTVYSNEPEDIPTEAEWALLCTRLRAMPEIEEIELGGRLISDAALAPLAGHPGLRKVEISYGRVTAAGCAKTFGSMPRLTRFELGEIMYDDVWASPEEQAKMSAAMPAVSIKLPSSVY